MARRLTRTAGTLLGAVLAASAACQPFTITRFQSDLTLRKDRTLHVAERIETRFNDRRRGIIRKIPISYDTGRGFRRDLSLRNITVADERGRAQETKIFREGDEIHIRVGNPDVWFEPGTRRTYVIQYDVRGMLNWFEAGEWEPSVELYWGLTGEFWDTNIERASFSLEYPSGKTGDGPLGAKVFYGPYGSRQSLSLGTDDQAATEDESFVLRREGNRILGEARNGFPAFAGWTVVVALPESSIPPPTRWEEITDFVLANPLVALPVGLFAFMFLLWSSLGRDPRAGPLVVQFDPPDGLTASEAGALLDEKVDQRDIAAGFVSLAQNGNLTMELEPGQGLFQRNRTTIHLTEKADTASLSAFERRLQQLLALSGRTVLDDVDLKTEVGPEISSLKASLMGSLQERGFYRANPALLRGCLVGLGFGVVALGCFASGALTGSGSWLVTLGSLVASGLIIAFFGNLMPRRTPLGVREWNKVRGFEEFIRRARGDELRWLEQKEPTQALFEEYLPYAVAFGLTREWADAFRNIELHAPDWYRTPYGYHFMPYSFADDLASSSGSLAAAASTPPRSSGGSGGHSGFSSGGGFSGGGFGGGGGSSW